MTDPGIPETGHWQARARAEETLSYEGRADCLDHAKEHARDVLVLEAECERLRAALTEAERNVDYLRSGYEVVLADCERLRAALKAICQTTDTGPWIAEYRAAGGGYEGLQAIARAALGEADGE